MAPKRRCGARPACINNTFCWFPWNPDPRGVRRSQGHLGTRRGCKRPV